MDVRDEEEWNLEPEAELIKDGKQVDEVEPPIITLEKIPVLEEQNGPIFISDFEEYEPQHKPRQVKARPSQNTCLRSELKNLATSYNQEAIKELEGLRDRENLMMELSKISDAHNNCQVQQS